MLIYVFGVSFVHVCIVLYSLVLRGLHLQCAAASLSNTFSVLKAWGQCSTVPLLSQYKILLYYYNYSSVLLVISETGKSLSI